MTRVSGSATQHDFPGQLVIGDLDGTDIPNWSTRQLRNGYFVHFHQDLRHAERQFGEHRYLLFGNVCEVREDYPAPEDALEDFVVLGQNLYRGWSGRWLLISDEELHIDASGLFGVHYGVLPRKRAKIVTTSLAVASYLDNDGEIEILPHGERLVSGLGWIPPPATALPFLKKLLPRQILHLPPNCGDFCHSWRESTLYTEHTDEPAETFARALVTGLSRFPGNYLLPLTGGLDSRTLAAALANTTKDTVAFTHWFPGIARGDLTMPPLVAAAAGMKHIQINDLKDDGDRARMFDLHAFGQCAPFRRFFAKGHYERLWAVGERTMLPGGCFETGRCYFWKRLPADVGHDLERTSNATFTAFRPGVAVPIAPLLKRGIMEWLESIGVGHSGVDWRDLFYIEQRLSGWSSAIEQATDANRIGKLHVANSHYLYGLMLSVSPEDRKRGKLQRDAIGILHPELLKLPINPPPSKAERTVQRARRIVQIARMYGAGMFANRADE